MKTILSSRKYHYLKIVGIFLIVIALVTWMVGCSCGDGGDGGDGGESYDLTISSTAGGSVTEPGEPGPYTYDEGEKVDLVAKADEGYRFVNWMGDVDTIADDEDAITTITMNDDYDITAKFEAIPAIQYTLTISSTEGGSVTEPGEPGPYTYDEGEEVHLVAEPEEGYRFVYWTGDVDTIDDEEDAETTITMNGDYDITAKFWEEVVSFADPNLEAAVREAIGIPEGWIYPSDLEGLNSLSALEKNIADLTGLEYCTSLIELLLAGNQIEDISPLANLTSMTELFLSFNQIEDISPLANLNNLTELGLSTNEIEDISPLADLTSLTGLDLGANQIEDISPLADLTSLTLLGLYSNQIEDISPLANLTSLTNLGLRHNQIIDISALADLTSLTWLGLDDNKIVSITPLADLTSLTNLDLEGNQIVSISPLADLTSLTELYLKDNQISDIFPLVSNLGLSDGDRVDLRNNPLMDPSFYYISLLEVRGVTVYY